MMRHRLWVGVIAAAALLAAACGGGGGGQPGGGQPGGTTGSAVNVSEKEWGIEIAGDVRSGSVTFAVKNNGAVEHNFVIKETGQRIDGLQPGQTKELAANLTPGTYTIICDIAGHEEAGMKTTVTVK